MTMTFVITMYAFMVVSSIISIAVLAIIIHFVVCGIKMNKSAEVAKHRLNEDLKIEVRRQNM